MLSTALLACAGGAPTSRGTAADAAGTGTAAAAKRITIAIQKEPSSFNRDLTRDTLTGGVDQVTQMAHQYLAIADDTGKRIPQLATQVISVEDGTWVVNPDGSMDTTWRIRPNALWQDGRPFTSDDLLFTLQVTKDTSIPNRLGAMPALMESAMAPDPLTFVMHWTSAYVGADVAPGLIPLARHLMEEAYLTQPATFIDNPLFSYEFIGLGPYRLTRWEQGVLMEFARFEGFYRGRPPIDSFVVRFIPDPNAMVANILSHHVDVVLPEGVDLDAAAELRERWNGTGNQVVAGFTGALRIVEMQSRAEYVQPRNGLPHVLVRQGLYHGIDRKTMAEIITRGFGPVADVWFPPGHPFLADVQSAVPSYPYDLNRAQGVLAQDGWLRDAEGALVYQSTGERFEIEVRNSPGAGAEKALSILADGWKGLGVHVDMVIIPSARASDREYRSLLPGAGITALTYELIFTDRLHSKSVSNSANRWGGPNRTGYTNPRVDLLLDQLNSTVPIAPRIELHRQFAREALADVALMPLYWEVSPVLSLRHVENIGKTARNINTWNMVDWTVR